MLLFPFICFVIEKNISETEVFFLLFVAKKLSTILMPVHMLLAIGTYIYITRLSQSLLQRF